MSMQSVEEFERRAQDAEQSPLPVFLRIGRAVVWMVYAIVVVIIVVLLIAFVLRLFGASTDAAFTRWIYRNSESAMRPFRGIFPVRELGDVSVLDASLLFGTVVYVFAALGLDAIVSWFEGTLRRKEYETAAARALADNVRIHAESQQFVAEQFGAPAGAPRPDLRGPGA